MDRRPRAPTGRTLELMARAADLRAAGASWEAVAKELGRKPDTVRGWPKAHPGDWERLLRRAEAEQIDTAGGEALTTLRRLSRSENERVRLSAAQQLARARSEERKRAARAPAAGADDGLDEILAFVRGLDDDQVEEL